MLSRLRDEQRGQSLPEMLVVMLVGTIVMIAIVEVTITSLRTGGQVSDRIESTENARLAVDRAVTSLTSQVCLDALTAPIVVGSTATTLTFYADLAPASSNAAAVRIERLTYDASARTITDQRWSGTTATGTPARTVVSQGVTAPSGGPFRYFEYTSAANGAAPTPTAELVPGPSGLTAADVADIVRVRVDLLSTTRRTNTTDGRSSTLGGDAYVGTLDPLQPLEGPRCSA